MDKGRNKHALIGACLAATLPGLAAAGAPSDAALGQIDAILSFCTKAVPKLEDNAHALRRLLSQGAPAGARSSAAYQVAYAQLEALLAKGNHGQEVALCTAGLGMKPPRERDGERE